MNIRQHQFIKWLTANGALIQKAVPHRFDSGLQGVIATESIAALQAIACIPSKLIISVDTIKAGPLRRILHRYPHLFSEALSDDADFNTLTLFVMLEKVKGVASHYYDYFEVCEDSLNMFSWTPECVHSIQLGHIEEKFTVMQKGLLKNYDYFMTFFAEQPQLARDIPDNFWCLFSHSYQFVMTRCYGGDGMLPSTSLVPFGDSMNHHHHNHTSFCLVNVDLENVKNDTLSYTQKKELLDLSILQQRGLNQQDPIKHENDNIGDTDFEWFKQHDQNVYMVIHSIGPIGKNQEVFNFFGEKSNEFLLLWYGFCYKDNIFDQFKFYVYLDQKSDFKKFSDRRRATRKINIIVKKEC